MKVRHGETILFIGDSITDCGRRNKAMPLGSGYVKMFNDLLISRVPERDVTIINKGISGDVVTGLRNRWYDDVLRHKPNWLSVKIGINDLNRTLRQNPEPVPPELYEEAYNSILARTKQDLPDCKILLITPFYVSNEACPNSFRTNVLELLPKYLDVVKKMSETYDTLLVNMHEVYQNVLKNHDPETLCPEPVHPNPTGHLVMAEAVYNALS